jgi:hypothetical protein
VVGIYFNISASASTDACSYLIIQNAPPHMAIRNYKKEYIRVSMKLKELTC